MERKKKRTVEEAFHVAAAPSLRRGRGEAGALIKARGLIEVVCSSTFKLSQGIKGGEIRAILEVFSLR